MLLARYMLKIEVYCNLTVSLSRYMNECTKKVLKINSQKIKNIFDIIVSRAQYYLK